MPEGKQRIDKWLWFARFAKTRTVAAKLVSDGLVRVNGTKASAPAKLVGPGDVLTIAAAHVTAVVRIVSPGERRGPAPEARLLYEDVPRDDGTLVTIPGSG
jgi:ribosome-associated heat shock protein Hsp15